MFETFSTLKTFREWRSQVSSSPIGLVPTMGNLHQGHLSLVKESLRENVYSIVSIFVNPKQFGIDEDYHDYPRTLEQDLEKLKALAKDKSLIVLAPQDATELYHSGFQTTIKVGDSLTKQLCGLFRPGHFEGVATVVYLLFAITRPVRAYFGQKDYQQFKVIEQMVRDLFIPVDLKLMPTVRDARGFALSSRNQYLSLAEYERALCLNQTLTELEKLIKRGGDQKAFVEKTFVDSALWEYLEILDADNLKKVYSNTKKILLAGALKIGQTRLIDNIIIDY